MFRNEGQMKAEKGRGRAGTRGGPDVVGIIKPAGGRIGIAWSTFYALAICCHSRCRLMMIMQLRLIVDSFQCEGARFPFANSRDFDVRILSRL